MGLDRKSAKIQQDAANLGVKHMIAIIDYNAGNLKSVEKALHFLGEECVITRDFHEIEAADKVILSPALCSK